MKVRLLLSFLGSTILSQIFFGLKTNYPNPFRSKKWISEKKIWKKFCGRTEKICVKTVLPHFWGPLSNVWGFYCIF